MKFYAKNLSRFGAAAFSIFAVLLLALIVSPVKAWAGDWTQDGVTYNVELKNGVTYNASQLTANETYWVDQVNHVTINLDKDITLGGIYLSCASSIDIKSSGEHKLTLKRGIYTGYASETRNIIRISDCVSLDAGYLSGNSIYIDTTGTINLTGKNAPDTIADLYALWGYNIVSIKNATVKAVADNSRKSTIGSRYLIEINNANVTASGGSRGLSCANDIKISGKNTVVNAKGSDDAIVYGMYAFTLSKPLQITTPSGGKIWGYNILDANGNNAKNVVIKANNAAYDGSAPGVPSAKGTDLKDKSGKSRGYVVTNAVAGKATVAYKGSASDKKKATITIPATIKDASGNTYKVTSVKDKAFQGNEVLKTIKGGSNIETIGTKAFYNCKNLGTAAIGKNVKTIKASAFGDDAKLKKVTITSKKLKTVGAKAFSGNPGSAVYTVPKGKVAAYSKLLKNGGINSKAKVTE